MTWSEAYYVWSGIQLAKQSAKKAIEKTNTDAMKAQDRLVEFMRNIGLTQKLIAVQNLLQKYMVALTQNLNQLKTNLMKPFIALATTVKTIFNPLQQSISRLIGVTNKLAAIFGEEIKSIRAQIQRNTLKILQKVFNTEIFGRLFKVFNDKQKEFFDLMARKIKSVNEKLIKLLSNPFKRKKKKKNKRSKNKK